MTLNRVKIVFGEDIAEIEDKINKFFETWITSKDIRDSGLHPKLIDIKYNLNCENTTHYAMIIYEVSKND